MKNNVKAMLGTVTALTTSLLIGATTTSANASTKWQARSVTQIKQSIDQVGFNNYVIQWGDTLSGISEATGVSIPQLVQINHAANADLITAGTHLVFNGNQMSVVQASGTVTGTYTVTQTPRNTAQIQASGSYTLPSANVSATNTQSSNTSVTTTTPSQGSTTTSNGTATSVATGSNEAGTTTNSNPDQNQVSYAVNYYLVTSDGRDIVGTGALGNETRTAQSGQYVTVNPRVDADGNYPTEGAILAGSDGPNGRVGVYGQIGAIPDTNLNTPDRTPESTDTFNPSNYAQSFNAANGQQVNFYYVLNKTVAGWGSGR